MSQNILSLDTELRKLRPAELYTLGQILNVSDSWKKLMAIIPSDETGQLPKFNSEHFSMIEQAVQQQKRNAAEIFLEEWATMGRNRPTLQVLLNTLVKAELFRAADYIATDLLKGDAPKRPEHGPAAVVDISEETIRKLIEDNALKDNNDTDKSLILGSSAELNMVKEIYLPEATVNATPNSYFQHNMQTTKLAEESEYACIKNNLMTDNKVTPLEEQGAIPSRVSDLLKFDSIENNVANVTKSENNNVEILDLSGNGHNSVTADFHDKEEISSKELPTILNEFAEHEDINQININEELKSDDLPLFLNNSMHFKELCETSSIGNASQLNSSIIQNEMTSSNLPQVIAQLSSNLSITDQFSNNESGSNTFNVQGTILGSQELPITVLEYHRD